MSWNFFSVSPDLDSNLHTPMPNTLLEPVHHDLRTMVTNHCPRGVENFIGGHQGGAEFNEVMEGVEGYDAEESGTESLFRWKQK